MKIKNIKFLPILVAFATGGTAICFRVIKNNNTHGVVITNINRFVESNIDNDFKDNEISDLKYKDIQYELGITFGTTEVIEPTEIIETTESTTINPYSEIMFLENVDSNVSLEDLNDFIIKYAFYSKYSYSDAVNIIYNNLDTIISDYSTLKGGIMCTLFNSASNDGLLSSTCNYSSVEKRDMTLEEKEVIMLDMCDALGLSNTDKTIVLAIFRHETGNGTSNRCVNDNNYGGIKVGEYFGVYQTPEYRIYKAIMCIDGHIERNKSKMGTSDMYTIVSSMSYSYCPGTASDWTSKIISFTNKVSEDYSDFSDSYEYNYEIK